MALAARRGQGRARPAEPARVRQALADRPGRAASGKPVKFGTCSSQVLSIFLDSHTAEYDLEDKKQLIWDMATRDEPRAPPARGGRREGHPDRGAHDPLRGVLLPRPDRAARLPRRRVQPRGRGSRRRRAVDPHLLGQPEHAEGLHAASRTRTRSRSTSSGSRATSGRSRRPRTTSPRSTCSSRTPTRSRRRSPSAW